jgi:hypothetical protein
MEEVFVGFKTLATTVTDIKENSVTLSNVQAGIKL